MAIFGKKLILCEHCGKAINPANEPNGEINYVEGKPWCALCRLVYLPKSGKIDYKIALGRKRDIKRFQDDMKMKQDKEQKISNDEVIDVALKSQAQAFEIDPKSKLQKTKK